MTEVTVDIELPTTPPYPFRLTTHTQTCKPQWVGGWENVTYKMAASQLYMPNAHACR